MPASCPTPVLQWKRCSLPLLLVAGLSPRVLAQSVMPCYATPLQAAAASDAAEPRAVPADPSATGFRLVGMRQDAAHLRTWALVARCDAADAPWIAVPLSGMASVATLHTAVAAPRSAPSPRPAPATRPAVVHAGDAVLFRNRAAGASVSIEADAEQSGAIGDRIRVRLKSFSTEPAAPRQQVEVVVVRAGEVQGDL